MKDFAITLPSSVTAPRASAEKAPPAGQAKEAASEFEALLIAQMLESARTSGGGWLGETDEAAQTMTGFAEQQLATVIARSGGLGLAGLIGSGLEPESHVQDAGDPAPAAVSRE